MKKIFVILLLAIFVNAQSQLTKANKLMLKNKFNEAVDILKNYLQENENAEAFLKLGLCYKNLMLNNKALDVIEKANELDSNNIDILTNLASLCSTVGFNDRAVEKYKKVIQLDSTNIFAKINLAKLYIDDGKWGDAESMYNDLLSADSNNSFYHRQLGYIFQKEEDWDKAFDNYKISFADNPKDLFTTSNYAKVYYQKEQPDSAIAIIDRGLTTFTNSSQLLKLKSDICFSIKDYGNAVNAIVRLIAKGEESALLYQRLGICYHQIAVENFIGDAQILKFESAIDALTKSTELDSTQSLTELYIGMAYKELEKNEKAIKHLQKSLELIYPNYTSAIYTNLAIVYNRSGNYVDAIKDFKLAKEFDEDNPNYFYYLASTYDQYYYDKKVPLIYYQMYLASKDSLEPALKNYAMGRIEELKETVHFQNGSNK